MEQPNRAVSEDLVRDYRVEPLPRDAAASAEHPGEGRRGTRQCRWNGECSRPVATTPTMPSTIATITGGQKRRCVRSSAQLGGSWLASASSPCSASAKRAPITGSPSPQPSAADRSRPILHLQHPSTIRGRVNIRPEAENQYSDGTDITLAVSAGTASEQSGRSWAAKASSRCRAPDASKLSDALRASVRICS